MTIRSHVDTMLKLFKYVKLQIHFVKNLLLHNKNIILIHLCEWAKRVVWSIFEKHKLVIKEHENLVIVYPVKLIGDAEKLHQYFVAVVDKSRLQLAELK